MKIKSKYLIIAKKYYKNIQYTKSLQLLKFSSFLLDIIINF